MEDVQELCEEAQITLAYLPPYSPDLNPIEEAFAELKAWLKKHQKLAENMEFSHFLEMGLTTIQNGARGHFARSHVGVPVRNGGDDDYWDD